MTFSASDIWEFPSLMTGTLSAQVTCQCTEYFGTVRIATDMIVSIKSYYYAVCTDTLGTKTEWEEEA